jgi:hypothetical protein
MQLIPSVITSQDSPLDWAETCILRSFKAIPALRPCSTYGLVRLWKQEKEDFGRQTCVSQPMRVFAPSSPANVQYPALP